VDRAMVNARWPRVTIAQKYNAPAVHRRGVVFCASLRLL
jgi:hypothetical protein